MPEAVELRRLDGAVAVGGQVVGAKGVDRDQDDGRAGEGDRLRTLPAARGGGEKDGREGGQRDEARARQDPCSCAPWVGRLAAMEHGGTDPGERESGRRATLRRRPAARERLFLGPRVERHRDGPRCPRGLADRDVRERRPEAADGPAPALRTPRSCTRSRTRSRARCCGASRLRPSRGPRAGGRNRVATPRQPQPRAAAQARQLQARRAARAPRHRPSSAGEAGPNARVSAVKKPISTTWIPEARAVNSHFPGLE